MKLRRSIVLLAIALGVCLALFGCVGPAPTATSELTDTAEFELSSLLVTPSEVVVGEPITVEALVTNVGKVESDFVAKLKVDEVVVATKEITVGVGTTKTVSFTYSANATGTHNVELDGLSATFVVLRPAEFEVSSLVVTPSQVTAGETVRIEASITNTGEVKGSYTATLTLEDEVSQTKEITVEAGATETVSFTYSADAVGTYSLGVDGLTATLKVLGPTPPEPAEVTIASNHAVADFPDTIAFILDGSSTLPVTKITLEYGTDKRSLVSEVSRVEPEHALGVKIRTSWVWEMKKTGSLPPGARVWWQWRITDEADQTYVTPRETIIFEDTRYQWQVEVAQDVDVHWHSLGASLVKDLTEGVESRLSLVKLEVSIPEERKPKVFVYPSAEELRSAVLFTQQWTGALAFLDYNIILIPVRSDNLEWAKRTLAHEITHLLVREATFGPFGDIPTWLSEGLAQYAEGDMEEYHRQVLERAIEGDQLISVRSLGGSFPADPEQASLAYAQSLSLVSYLVLTYGWADMRELLTVFKEGSTYDNALQKVYSFNIEGLEERWRGHIRAS